MAFGFLLWSLVSQALEATWIYTVQISAEVRSVPTPEIRLSWPADAYGANSYNISRKAKEATTWTEVGALPGTATTFTDTDVETGHAYEYQIFKVGPGHTGYGYIYAGIEAPLIESRGKLVLVVATNATVALSNELSRLKQDLIGDGWQVLRWDVSSNATPESVRSAIIDCYQSDPANVNAVFLLGHVPVFKCGTNLNYDGHLNRAMPSDAFYGDVDGNWNAGTEFLPSDVELMVGRVDLFNMPGVGSEFPWPNETELLRNYLDKDHRWRHAEMAVQRRALMGDRRGAENGEATAASGYRNFGPLVGPGNTVWANVEDGAADSERWISVASSNSYLWAYGCGGGLNNPSGVSQLGTNGTFHDLWSIDVVNQDARVVFSMFFGSWFGDWDGTDNFLRAFLATPTMGLASFMAGRPHWFVHHMGLGETIGYSTRLNMNNSRLYQGHSNGMTRAIYIALMGDPTLRMDPVPPPTDLRTSIQADTVKLSWTPPPGEVEGYHVYWAASWDEPFGRLTGSLLGAPEFFHTNAPVGTGLYMVRAVRLSQTPGGTYFNASQGIFAEVNVIPSPILVWRRDSTGLRLSWNSIAGVIYRVESTDGFSAEWTDRSGASPALDSITSWLEPQIPGGGQRFYRVTAKAGDQKSLAGEIP